MDDNIELTSELAVELSEILFSVNSTDIYVSISELIQSVQKKLNITEHEAHKVVTNAAIYIETTINKKYKTSNYGETDFAEKIRKYFYLLLYPVTNGYKIVDKTKNDFNIDFNFFNNMFLNIDKSSNTEKIYSSNYILNDYKFEGHRLSEFSIKNVDHDIIYYYNDEYEQISIEFLDGKQLNIG